MASARAASAAGALRAALDAASIGACKAMAVDMDHALGPSPRRMRAHDTDRHATAAPLSAVMRATAYTYVHLPLAAVPPRPRRTDEQAHADEVGEAFGRGLLHDAAAVDLDRAMAAAERA